MDDILKRNIAEDTIRQKEIAKQMAKQMIMQKQQANVQLVSADDKARSDVTSKNQKLDSMLSDRDSSKSEFDKYMVKIDGVMTTGISEILTGKDRIATDFMLDKINMDDIIPVLAERSDILDASQDMASALTDKDANISKFYDRIKDKIQQYKEEKTIAGEDHYEDSDADFYFNDSDKDEVDSNYSEYLDDKPPYDLNAFVNFKDTFVDYFNHKKHSNSDDLKRGLQGQMNVLVQEQSDQLQGSAMLGAGSGSDIDGHPKVYQGINDKLYGSDSDFQEDQNAQLMFLEKLCPKGMMGAIMLAFFVAQQAMQENMKGPASDVYSTSATVSRLSQFSNAMKKMDATDDNGKKLSPVYVKGEDGNYYEKQDPTPEDYAAWVLANANKAHPVKPDDKTVCGTTLTAAKNLIDFIKQGAHIFGSNLDNYFAGLPSDIKTIESKDIDEAATQIGEAYRALMGTNTNGGGKNKDGIVAQWLKKNDPNNAAAILQILNSEDSYNIYKGTGQDAFAQYNSAKEGLSANLSTSTAALNLGQSQQNANNTAFYGWMKSWEDNAIEISRKTG
jgi:hypothetical protein